jgi:hypothetical protein
MTIHRKSKERLILSLGLGVLLTIDFAIETPAEMVYVREHSSSVMLRWTGRIGVDGMSLRS